MKAKGNLNEDYLSCWYTNATSLNNKFDEFTEEINASKSLVVFVCETWWTEKSATNIPGYNLYRKDHHFSRGGGLEIYIRDNLNSYPVNEKCLLEENVEKKWCVIEVGKEKILCGCIYRTGKSDIKNCVDITKSLEFANRFKQRKNCTGLLICGDFNFSSIKWNQDNFIDNSSDNDNITNKFIKCLQDCFLHQNVNKPSFQNEFGRETNILDLILTENSRRIKDLKIACNNKRDHWFRCLNSGFKNLEDLKKYKKLKKEIKKQVKKSIREFEEDLALNSKNNPKSVYSYINSKNQVKESIKAVKLANGSISTDIQEIVNELNELFASVFTKNESVAQEDVEITGIQCSDPNFAKITLQKFILVFRDYHVI